MGTGQIGQNRFYIEKMITSSQKLDTEATQIRQKKIRKV